MGPDSVDLGLETGIDELRGVGPSSRAGDLVAAGWTPAEDDRPVRAWTACVELTREPVRWLGWAWTLRLLTTDPLHIDLWPIDEGASERALLDALSARFGRPPGPAHRWTLPSGLRLSLDEGVVVLTPAGPRRTEA